MTILKVIQYMWLGAMLLAFFIAVGQYYKMGMDTTILYTIGAFLLSFYVYHQLGKVITKKERKQKKFK